MTRVTALAILLFASPAYAESDAWKHDDPVVEQWCAPVVCTSFKPLTCYMPKDGEDFGDDEVTVKTPEDGPYMETLNCYHGVATDAWMKVHHFTRLSQ